MKSKR
jgi:hypothetical protein